MSRETQENHATISATFSMSLCTKAESEQVKFQN